MYKHRSIRKQKGTLQTKTSLLIGAMGLLLALSASAHAGGWKSLGDKPQEISKNEAKKLMRADGLKSSEKLLKYPHLVRIAIRDTGGGSSNHSEVAVRFRWIPKKVFAKAWSDGKERNRAQLGAYGACKIPKAKGSIKPVGRTCTTNYNGRGFVDVTEAFSDRNMLFVHDPGAAKKGNSIIWAASEKPQENMWHYVFQGSKAIPFGFGRINAKLFQIKDSGDEPSVTTPPSTPDESGPESTTAITGEPKRQDWKLHDKEHKPVSRSKIIEELKKDGVPNPAYMLSHRYLVRLLLNNTGGGSSSYSEVMVKFPDTPQKALGKAWADRKEANRAQIGALGECRKKPTSKGAMKSTHICPFHFSGLGWRNLVGAFTAKTIFLINNPNNNNKGGTLLWAAFDKPQDSIAHKIPDGLAGPSFGLGNLSVKKYAIKGAKTEPHPVSPPTKQRPRGLDSPERDPRDIDSSFTPRPPREPPKSKWTVHKTSLKTLTPWQLARLLRKERLRGGTILTRYAYLVRVEIQNTGGGAGRRSEVGLKFKSRIRSVLGKASADDPAMGRAQIGPMSSCKAGKYRNLPPGWRTCPVHYNNLGWRDLSSKISGHNKILIINQPRKPHKANTTLWFAFTQNPGPIMVRHFQKAGRYTLKTGKLRIQKIKMNSQSAPGRRRPSDRPHYDSDRPHYDGNDDYEEDPHDHQPEPRRRFDAWD